jgi:hypothetical protein
MNKKFDVVIGNPPYQEEAQGAATNQMPIYHLFMEAAYEVGKKVVLITPARFLFNAGYTPKAWNMKMLEDPHLTVPHYAPNSAVLFPGTDIKGGVAVTYRDETLAGEPVGLFTKHPELTSILHKLSDLAISSFSTAFTSSRSYRYTDIMHSDYPRADGLMPKGDQFKLNTRAFEQLPFLFQEERPSDGNSYVRVAGLVKNRRAFRWIRHDYIAGPPALRKYKVALSKASGSGAFGETFAPPLVLDPDVAVTGTFITVGAFDTELEVQACVKYIKSKFARALLGVLKVTQDNMARVWKYVPLQDFTSTSDIDWSKTIPEVDQQLYAKYKLDADEIAFIESHVKPMG